MFSFPSVVSPNFFPLLSPLPGPLPGIYYICAIPSPAAQLALPSFPWAGEGPRWGFCTETFVHHRLFCIFLILLRHEILKVISVHSACVLFGYSGPGDEEEEPFSIGIL